MKRRVAFAMAAVLFLCNPLQSMNPVLSVKASIDSRLVGDTGDIASVSNGQSGGAKAQTLSEDGGTGWLKLRVQGTAQAAQSQWTVELYPSDGEGGGESITDSFTMPAMEDGRYSQVETVIKDIPDGTYDLRLVPSSTDGNSYVPYEQKGIKIKGDMTTLRLMNDLPESHGYGDTEKAKIGVLSMGDINGDDQIDDADKEELLKIIAMEDRHDDAFFDRADLNGDGQVDLLDVAHFTKYYQTGVQERKAEPVKAVLVRAEEVKASASNADITQGSIEAMMAGEGSLALEAEGEITRENPVKIEAEFNAPKQMRGFVIEPVMGSGGSIRDAVVQVEDENGKLHEFQVVDGQVNKQRSLKKAMAMAAANVVSEEEETVDDDMRQGVPIEIDLGGQVAVKKVTISVSKTLESKSLVEISRVEFLNDMENRIPEPMMAGPDRLKVEDGDASFVMTWKKQANVTGYEVTVSDEENSQTYPVEAATIMVSSLAGDDLINGKEYKVEVRSVNGTWRSPSSFTTAHPRAVSLPPAPENVAITGGYRRLAIQWKDMKDTDTYTLYYRKAADTEGTFQSVPGIEENRYDLRELEDETEYEIYLTGSNPLGEGPGSIHYKGKTVSLNPPETPNYKLINTPQAQTHTAHIESVLYGGTDEHEFDVVDGDYTTSWVRLDWDAGNAYPGENKAPIVTLNQEYEMDTVALIPDEEQKFDLTSVRIDYWDAANNKKSVATRLYKKTSNDKTYYMVQAVEPFTAKRVQLAMRTFNQRRISVAEYKFYYYDPLEDDIMGLYTDTYHVSLREDVTQGDIDNLRKRLNTTDPASGEYHPKKDILEAELANAEQILKEGSSAADIMVVDNKDTEGYDSHITFRGGLNVYQPLGVTVRAGDTITVYAGGPRHEIGDGTRLQVVVSQYHGSSNAVFRSVGYLKAGPNEITIPAVDNMDLERGGQIYIAYTGTAGAEEYGVRVVGGTRIPVLDLSDMSLRTMDDPLSDETCRTKVMNYIDALEDMQGKAQQLHQENHADYPWQPQNCVYEATDIVTRYTMLSLATERVLAGIGNGTKEEKAQNLVMSLKAMDEMMYLFYQHKGLNENPGDKTHNRVPVSRINIRYQRMFAGAFMYAGGKHIGIEWSSLSGMVNGRPVVRDENGKWISGQYFGWGIAHEIGHEINEGAYTVAEVTNNYFSLLAQARDTNTSVRFTYDKVFDKVTSGTKGKASNVFVQLAMYWQLHLAYDRGYNFKIYDDPGEQLDNLFFARVDSYARKISEAPGSLSLNGADTDNKLMRLAMASAQKNLLSFFEHWGMEPDEETIAYAGQFEEETRGIWFANDETRVKQIEAGADQNLAEAVKVTGTIDYTEGSNEVTLNLSSSQDIWIYEIRRYERVKDEIVRRPVGYVQANGGEAQFTDVIGTINNHAFTYEVIGYDQWLNPTKTAELGEVKVSHDGNLDKDLWQITTNMTNGELEDADDNDPEVPYQPGLELMCDNDMSTSFTGKTEGTQVPEIVIHLNQLETITGLKYAGTAVEGLEIYVSESGGEGNEEWTMVKTHASGIKQDGSATVYHFTDGTNLFTYDASYVKLTAPGQGGKELTVAELSLMGETGDNVSLESTGSIGILSEDYVDGTTIPQGSLVFTGTYKGNPAYNTVLLWDDQGNIVGGTDEAGTINAEEVIFAPDPQDGMLGEVSDGIWVYYIKPGFDMTQLKGRKIRAELYRVDDAMTQEGERLVSSTVFVEIPDPIPSIKLNKGTGGGE
ncbi:MAG: hypothetical protein HFG77_03620 [Hungatella sp.]|jgi:hypothetical protein|nr:hypothetical protein [Hungatella sp.]